MMGQRVRTLENCAKIAGQYTVRWDGKDESGVDAASGVYLYLLKTESFTKTMKMILLR
jgi:flagellar hook assembly protein FlgD